MPSNVFRARWILPIGSPPIENGRLVVRDGRIESVEQANGPEASATDLGDVIVVPGFVNAHTHLHLTCCRDLVSFDGSFVRWIDRLTALFVDGDLCNSALGQTMLEGCMESLIEGVTAVGDIGCGRAAAEHWAELPLNVAGFLETLGIGPRERSMHDRAVGYVLDLCHGFTVGGSGGGWNEELELVSEDSPGAQELSPLDEMAEQASDEEGEDDRGAAAEQGMGRPAERDRLPRPLFRLGISPHAPYSTSARVYREVVSSAKRHSGLVCTHLAETQAELEFLRRGSGEFREFLERLRLWDGSFEVPGCSPVQYMDRLGLLALQPLLVHCNYVSDDDLDLIADAGAAVAFCPRSHDFFQHEPHRWRDMLARGINVCIGTDSLASNRTLSVLDELRFLRQADPAIPGELLLHMGTLAGAQALGFDDQIGSLEIGKRADFTVIPIDGSGSADPSEALLIGTSRPSTTYLGGDNPLSGHDSP